MMLQPNRLGTVCRPRVAAIKSFLSILFGTPQVGTLSAMRRRKQPHPSLIIRDDIAEDVRLCEWPGCPGHGEHKAPRSRDQLREYRWFCMDHVRLYNSRWNYFEGMSDVEMEQALRHDITWNRPTWPLGDSEGKGGQGPKPGSGSFGFDPDYVQDIFGMFEDEPGAGARGETASAKGTSAETRAALALFGLEFPITADTLKTRYKELVKRHHPDANDGNKAAEEKFKEICSAYDTLRAFLVI